MPERNVPWQIWVIVTLGAAVLSSPLALRFFGAEAETGHQPAGLVAPPPAAQPQEGKRTAEAPPPVNTYLPAPAGPPAPEIKAVKAAASGYAASERYLTTADLDGLSRWELDVLRNSVYARHGRRFRRADLQRYFDAQSWYRPAYGPDQFPEGVLSPVERYNVDLIADFQRRVFGSP